MASDCKALVGTVDGDLRVIKLRNTKTGKVITVPEIHSIKQAILKSDDWVVEAETACREPEMEQRHER